MRQHVVVRLEDGDVGATRFKESTVDSLPIAAVRLVDDPDPMIARLVPTHDGKRAVSRAVVHHDDLEGDAIVPLGGGERLVEVPLSVIAGHHDGDVRLVRHGTYLPRPL